MKRDHGRLLFRNWEKIDPLIKNLREGIYKSRKIAFEAFQGERNNDYLPGLGIGFFTKLICFLSPKLNGYIMDQWASKSINLLTGENIVKITKQGWVKDTNNSESYELYCEKIDILAGLLNCSGFEAEERIFSAGRGKGKWRNYLKTNLNTNTVQEYKNISKT